MPNTGAHVRQSHIHSHPGGPTSGTFGHPRSFELFSGARPEEASLSGPYEEGVARIQVKASAGGLGARAIEDRGGLKGSLAFGPSSSGSANPGP
eukprot:CAMPEP_0206531460 /NCGR_PEP_ID=MMETSP0325_2-20121206/3772_1 /ASSEMBLY_ACC=CAM_ASM_000347 /TAXON_ID=2866 /ORGANISM="Crypthecodinium cohnii, Strain Seligo" /LENGTH=93 /DNA_ID=CAMNT_0054027695 /DNA_START=238 /DNA_END=520 /DNA_ORIENTATION=+